MNMIEKVARCICGTTFDLYKNIKYLDDPANYRIVYININWDQYITQAKAAIEAMKEPTVFMSNQGLIAHADFDSADTIYKKMIEAALKELPIDRWHNGSDGNGGTVSVTCWQLTPEELAEVIESGGKVFVATLTKSHPAMYVGTEDSVRTLCVDYGPVWKKEKIDGNQD